MGTIKVPPSYSYTLCRQCIICGCPVPLYNEQDKESKVCDECKEAVMRVRRLIHPEEEV